MNFDWREFFSDKKNLAMAIVIGVLLLALLIALIATRHSSNSNDSESNVVTTTGVVQSESEGSDNNIPVTVDSEMASSYSKSITNAKNLYQGKNVTISAFPAYVMEDGSGIVFDMESPEDKSTVHFTVVAENAAVKKQIASLDQNQQVSVTGLVEDVTADKGFEIIASDVKGVAAKGVTTTATKKDTGGTNVENGTVVATSKSNSGSTYTTNANSVLTVAKAGSNYVLYADNNKLGNYKGLAHVSINGENGYYYFNKGVWLPKYNNIVEYSGTRYMVVNGKAQTQFTGKFILDDKTYHVTNGVIE